MHTNLHLTRSYVARTVAVVAIAIGALVALAHSSHAASARARRTSYAPHARSNILLLRGSFLGRQRATWYGPGFFGHRTACGETLQSSTWGIAHPTLPCGTLVTIVRGARRISVRVIDRGPFSGASLDLTKRTRDYLRFVDGDVSMTVVKRYRLVHRHAA